MNRLFESGEYVLCCTGPEVTTVPPVTLSWYHRTAACDDEEPATVCVSQRDSCPPMLRYWFCIIRRSWSVSMLLPLLVGTVAGAVFQVDSVTLLGPVNVDEPGLAQLTANFQMRAALGLLQMEAKRFGRPAGGGVPRTLLGRRLKTVLPPLDDGALIVTTCTV